MIRVTRVDETPGRPTLRLEGRLVRATVEELEMECRQLLDECGRLAVDAAGLQFADDAGLGLLRRLGREGVRLDGLTPLVGALMGEDTAAEPGRPADGRAETAGPGSDEAGLVARLRAGDAAAFEEMVRSHGPRLLATARRMLPCEDDAHDVVQEAMLSALRSIASFEGTSRLATWLHRIAVNSALMKMRSRRRRREDPIDDLLPRFAEDGHFAEPVAPWDGGAEALLAGEQSRAMVRRAIARLPESYRTVLVMRDIEELDTAETARLLGLQANAVKTRLHRARQALRALIEQETGATGR